MSAARGGGVLLALVLVPLLALIGCGDGSDSQGSPTFAQPGSALPANPEDWVCEGEAATQQEIDEWCQTHTERGRPLPDVLRHPPQPADFEAYEKYNERLKEFVVKQEYLGLDWIHDKNWRFSGPAAVPPANFSGNYGPHFPLRVYYSPEVVDWLCNGRQGELPDGAAMIKAMDAFFALLGVDVAADGCMDIRNDGPPLAPFPVLWAPMIKTNESSYDGWYWALPAIDLPPEKPNPPQFPPPLYGASAFTSEITAPLADNPSWYPTGGILQDPAKPANVVELIPLAGHPYCLSCHATAVSQSTFASMDNILGKELRYKKFDRTPVTAATPTAAALQPFPTPRAEPAHTFVDLYDQLEPVSFVQAWATRMPAETYDKQVLSAHDGPGQFLTAAQCNACHNATPQSPLLPNMALVEDPDAAYSPLRNLSPYGEWRVSPMGLSGRDPVFFAQLQSETNTLPENTTCIETLCLHCHGAMGERQLAIDTPDQADPACRQMFPIPPPPQVPVGKPLARSVLQQWPGGAETDEQIYGALARDGISCTVCHHIAPTDLGQEQTFTGNFITGPPDEIYGPYKSDSVVTKPMEQALGITPQFGAQITNSDLCGSCHNILLPIYDNDGALQGASYEQSTHLEWLNSDTGRAGSAFRSCQDCHMPTQYKGTDLELKIANSETNEDFPPTTNRLPDDEIQLTKRSHYARHSLHGLNVFLNQFFQQFPLILGIQQIDFMSEQPSPLDPPAIPFSQGYLQTLPLIAGFQSMLEMAENDTATVDIGALQKTSDGRLSTVVTVRNQTGHYLPTGVGFRRILVEFRVLDAQGATLWASGRTNDLGFILDGITDRILDSEQPVKYPAAPIQPHYQVIESGAQVQIYQELIRDSAGALTTSFLRRVRKVKDNRIRPKGFSPEFFAQNPSPYIQELAVLPGDEARDPCYTNPRLTGEDKIEYRIPLDAETLDRADHVEVNLYYQSIPPFYLQQRFYNATQGPAAQDDIQRLYYLTSHLNLDAVTDESGEALLNGWKLRVAGDSRQIN